MRRSTKSGQNFETYVKFWNDTLSYLGLAPVVRERCQKGEIVYRAAVWRALPSLLVIAMCGAIFFVQAVDRRFDIRNIGNSIISGYLNLGANLVTCLNIASSVCNAKSYAALTSSFLKFNAKSLNARVNAILKLSAKFISFFLLMLGFGFWTDILVLDRDKDLINRKFLLNYISALYNSLCVCHFAVCCFWLREYLLGIIREVENHSKFLSGFRLHFRSAGSAFMKVNQVRPCGPCPNAVPESAVTAMKYIRRLYHQVYLLSDAVNGVFSSRNLLTVAHNFFQGIILIYCGLSEIVKHSVGKSHLNDFQIMNFFKYSLISFLSIYGLIWPSAKVYSEVQSLSMLIQEYFTKAPRGELETELHSFIMQLYHERIIFSPHGFFSLNNKLLLTIVGSAASYLVILVQFRVTVT